MNSITFTYVYKGKVYVLVGRKRYVADDEKMHGDGDPTRVIRHIVRCQETIAYILIVRGVFW